MQLGYIALLLTRHWSSWLSHAKPPNFPFLKSLWELHLVCWLWLCSITAYPYLAQRVKSWEQLETWFGVHIPVQTTFLWHIFYSFKLSIHLAKKLTIVQILGPAAAKLVRVIFMWSNEMHPYLKGYLPFHLILVLGSTTRQSHLQWPTNKHLALYFIPHPLFFWFQGSPSLSSVFWCISNSNIGTWLRVIVQSTIHSAWCYRENSWTWHSYHTLCRHLIRIWLSLYLACCKLSLRLMRAVPDIMSKLLATKTLHFWL